MKNNHDTSFKACLKEVMVWRQLCHPYILPLLGMNEDLFGPRFCLISPWMHHITCLQIIKIADAIQWLHSLQLPVVHANIKGANILISNDMHCYLADFGLAFVIETFNPRRSSSLRHGMVHWLAPEYLQASSWTEAYITSLDMYAFGCTIVEIYTGKPPFSFLMHDSAVIYEVLVNQNQPPHP
ncbi:kinase-like domain-containing protein, partial [Armillaria novae-zelandiae]